MKVVINGEIYTRHLLYTPYEMGSGFICCMYCCNNPCADEVRRELSEYNTIYHDRKWYCSGFREFN